jgi:hypothetical protein
MVSVLKGICRVTFITMPTRTSEITDVLGTYLSSKQAADF